MPWNPWGPRGGSARGPERGGAAARPQSDPGPRPPFGSGPRVPAAPPPPREQFATLTEDDLLDQCARETAPPPMPAADYVREMMRKVDGDPPPAAPRPAAPDTFDDPFSDLEVQVHAAPPAPSSGLEEVELDELPAGAEADLLEEIGQTYLSRLGGRGHVPFTVMPPEEALSVPLDHWAGFVLSLIDGTTSIEQVIDASAMPEVEALRVLSDLYEQGIIDVRPARPTSRAVPRPARRV
jgi:hypothetical protein